MCVKAGERLLLLGVRGLVSAGTRLDSSSMRPRGNGSSMRPRGNGSSMRPRGNNIQSDYEAGIAAAPNHVSARTDTA